MHLGRALSDVSQTHQGFGSCEHHTHQASSGDPAGGNQDSRPGSYRDQSHQRKTGATQSAAPELLWDWEVLFWCVESL